MYMCVYIYIYIYIYKDLAAARGHLSALLDMSTAHDRWLGEAV